MKQCPVCNREMREQLLFCPFDGQTLISVDQGDKFIGFTLDDKYRLDEKIGEGGMGKVYRATHILMDHTVAIKILRPHLSSDEVALERFRREARAAASIRHPNAVAVTDFGVNKETGLSYLVMELLEGVELRDRMKEKQWLGFEESFIIVQQICLALQAAHAKGIIHRDLKPDNIWLLKSDDDFPRVKVLDFGIAKLKTAETSNLTQQGMIVGTPFYMSPEQCVGDELDARSDIYSLGIIIYEILTGKVPFRASTPMGVALKHSNELPKPLHQLRSDMPHPIENVVLRALKKQREDRQDSAMQLAQEFEAALYEAGVELKFLGTKTPQQFHTFSTNPDQAYRSAEADRSQSPDRSLSPQRLADGASGAVAQPKIEPPLPGARVATPDMFQQVARAPLSILNWLSEAPTSRKILVLAFAAVLVVATVVTAIMLAPGETTPVEQAKGGSGGSQAGGIAPTPPPGMAYVPGGKFLMGYDGSDEESEKPEHEVTVGPFFVDKYEVTVGEYYQFVKTGRRGAPENWPESWKEGRFKPEDAKLPVTDVTWFDAREYAKSVGKRLLSEEEWEYAARGTDKRLRPWGNDFNPNYANVGDPEKREIRPVGSYPVDKSPFEVFDMAGNVFEWTGSDWSSYPNSKAAPVAGKMVRGGSYSRDRTFAMGTSRSKFRPDDKQGDIGFRCAMDAPKQ